MEDFESLDLHDASINGITIDWGAGTVTVDALVFREGRALSAKRCKLVWSGVTRFVADRELPWGPSNFVNTAKFEEPSRYELQMQSGDVLLIDAKAFILHNA